MLSNSNKTIREMLYNIMHTNFNDTLLRGQIIEYIDYQANKGFPFGELLVLHYKIFGGTEIKNIYVVAAAIEILVLSFDILDDYEDRDVKDRPWSLETNLALNSTTALLFLSIDVLRKTNFKNKDKATSYLIKYSLKSINGQHKDLLHDCKNEERYIQMALEKSGALTALSCIIGVILAIDHYPKEVEIYSSYIGLIGQINNDLIDVQSWDEKNDLINKKYTLPIIYLLNHLDRNSMFINDYYNNRKDRHIMIENRKNINKMLNESGAITYTQVIKKIFQNRVTEYLKELYNEQKYIDQLLKFIE